ncbi:MAG TPA: acryloyl-CoA reductase [Acidimicrobiales bacterium]|nr:acryloyl-CoA reductase [Acidimicrobiales bacterium]
MTKRTGTAAVPDRFPAYLVTRHETAPGRGLGSLSPADLPAGEILVQVQWSSVNYKDALVTRPGNRVARLSPLVPGVDLAGRVVASDDPSVAVGSVVLAQGGDIGVSRHGGFAAYARVPAGLALPLPAGLSARAAMIIGTAGFTAALSADRLEDHGLAPGDGPVLVTGASGGVGSFAVALLAGRGHQVVASTAKTGERDWLETLGATEVVGRDDLDPDPDRVLGPERWAGAVDCVGGVTLSRILRTLRYGAAVAASGLTGGTALETTVFPFITRDVALLGVDTVRTGAERRVAVWERLAGDVAGLDLESMVAREISLDQLDGAIDDVLAARVRGRVLVRLDGTD